MQQLRYIKPSGIEKIGLPDNLNELSSEDVYWLEIKTNDRNAVEKQLKSFGVDEKLAEYVGKPELFSRVRVVSNFVVTNLPVVETEDFHKEGYLTIMVINNLLITILGEKNSTLDGLKNVIDDNPVTTDVSIYLLLYYTISEVLRVGMDVTAELRKKVNTLNQKMFLTPNDLSSKDILQIKLEVNVMSSVAAEQYYILGFIPKIDWENESNKEKIRAEMKETIRGLGYITGSLDRLEDKVESMYLQYQMILQEKGNKKLNTLTVVQSIFVPLTFIAGIYGMNFTNMPELQWHAGYFIILGIMGLISLGELLWFKMNGWFD